MSRSHKATDLNNPSFTRRTLKIPFIYANKQNRERKESRSTTLKQQRESTDKGASYLGYYVPPDKKETT